MSAPAAAFALFVVVAAVFLFRATSAAYRSSQARDRVGAAAASLHHSSQPCQIPDPLSEARDQTHILMDASQIRYH